tara:strand:+ start:201 stop:338 length:138 start_codon:yes stop_codon:yes gene_type:complete
MINKLLIIALCSLIITACGRKAPPEYDEKKDKKISKITMAITFKV